MGVTFRRSGSRVEEPDLRGLNAYRDGEHPLHSMQSPEEITAWGISELTRRLESYEVAVPEVKVLDDKAKYRIVSGIQKAVRRGNVLSVRQLVSGAYDAFLSYLRYRGSVIVIEDIGFGNFELLVLWCAALREPDWAKKQGKKLMLFFFEQMARSVKSRLCDETSSVATNVEVKKLPLGQGGLLEQTASLIEAWRGDRLSEARAYLWEAEQPAVAYAVETLMSSQKYNMPLALPAVSDLYLFDEFSVTGREFADVEDRMIGAYCSSTFDQHTREGQIALGMWRKRLPPGVLDSLGKVKSSLPKLFGLMLFLSEGVRCNARVRFPEAKKVEDLYEKVMMEFVGTVEQGVQAIALLREHEDLLYKMRKRLLLGGNDD